MGLSNCTYLWLCELLDEEITDLSKLLYKYEQHRYNGATWNNISDQTKQQIHGIVGFKVKINKIEASYKLSQNRPKKTGRILQDTFQIVVTRCIIV